MNQLKLLVLSLIVTLSFSSCEKHELKYEEARNLDVYTQIIVSSGIDLTISEGEPGAITIRSNQSSVFGNIETSVENEVLRIGFLGNGSYNNLRMNISIPANNLSRIEGSGGSNINIVENNNVLNSSSFTIELSGGGDFEGIVNTKAFTVDFSGGGGAELEGSVETLTVDLSGGGKFNGKKFTTGSLNADISGGGDMWINITTEITRASLSGGSKLYYTGKDINIVSIGGGDADNIEHKDRF